MKLADSVFLVTGGASGLGRACASSLVAKGGQVVIADLPTSPGQEVAESLGSAASFVAADVTDAEQVALAVAAATSRGSLRGVVHTAGAGGAVRFVGKDGSPGDAERFAAIVRLNLIGTFLVGSHAAAAIAKNEPIDGERGAIVFTASAAAYEGQIGQAGYAASKAGVVGLTLVAARDLASRLIRVCTIAPGLMDTPLLSRLRDDIKDTLAASVPNPARLGASEEFAHLACSILENGYLNGETIRLDGAIRMAPR